MLHPILATILVVGLTEVPTTAQGVKSAALAGEMGLGLVRLISRAWVYSYFWTATALIYLLLRHDVDGTAWNDVDRPEHADDTFAPEPEPSPVKDLAPVDPLAD